MSLKLRENLIRIMKEKNITQAQLAKLAKLPSSTLHGYLNLGSKQSKIDISQVKKICDALEIDMHIALFGEPDPYSKATIPEEILTKLFEGDVRISISRIDRAKLNKN